MNERWRNSMREHDEIVAALMARDEDRVRQAIWAHCRNSVDFRSNMLRHGAP
jgi:DNA-binding FadR family transcriptional regulator